MDMIVLMKHKKKINKLNNKKLPLKTNLKIN